MLKGLRRKETYDELINELGIDPIKRYPDRRATQIENSNYLSQLASGFQEVLAQNDRIVKEKTKELLLQESTGASNISHREHSVYNSVHSNHDDDDLSSMNDEPIPPPPPPPHQEIRTEIRQGLRGVAASVSPVIHLPAASLNSNLINSMLNPDITMSASSSSTKRKPQVFNIADDIDQDIEEHHQQHAEDFQMQQEQEQEKQHDIVLQAQAIMDEANDQLMPFVRTKRENSPPATAPRAKAKPTPKKPARPNPDADKEPDRTPKKTKKDEKTEKPKEIKKTIKKDNQSTKIKHETETLIMPLEELQKKNKGFLVDQIHKRPGIKFTKTDAKKMSIKDMAEKIFKFDNKK